MKERAAVVSIGPKFDQYYIEETLRLAETAGAEVVQVIFQRRTSPDPAYFVGRGKLSELKAISSEVDLFIFAHPLSPIQFRNLERELGKRVVDRYQLIMDIFALHAGSKEAKIQVEMAQLKYLLPRITGLGRELSRLGGGIGTRGPGEKLLETARRHILKRLSRFKKELEAARRSRGTQRKRRLRSDLPKVSLVGYTNAGKSSIMRRLSRDSTVKVRDELFATLGTLVRRVYSKYGVFLLEDTVGFIRDLPPDLIAAFHSTLEEILYSDLILHVIDSASPYMEEQIATVEEVLAEIGASNIPVLFVFNKIDLVSKEEINRFLNKWKPSTAVSALKGIGFEELVKCIFEQLRFRQPIITSSSGYE